MATGPAHIRILTLVFRLLVVERGGPPILLSNQRRARRRRRRRRRRRWTRRRWRVRLPVGRGRRSDDGGRHRPRGGRGGHEVVQAQHGRHPLLNSPILYPDLLPKVSSCWLKEWRRQDFYTNFAEEAMTTVKEISDADILRAERKFCESNWSIGGGRHYS